MSSSKSQEISNQLRDEILRGQYRAGERLPSERELATRFESNRSSVREAIKRLEQMGIVQVTPGGVRILPIEEATLEVLGYLMDLEDIPSPTLVGQLFEVFGAMLALSARSALRAASVEERQRMVTLVRRIKLAANNPEEYGTAWQDLRNCFTEVNQNLVLRLIGNGLKTQFMGRLEGLGVVPEMDMEQDRIYLDELESALACGDPRTTSNAIISHFELLKEGFEKALQKHPGNTLRSANA